MKFFLIILFIVCSVFCQVSRHMETRLAGVVTEVKMLYMDDQKAVYILVRASQNYTVIGHNEVPYIYVGDTLFEYWADYRKIGVGTKRNLFIYKLSEKMGF